MFSIARFLMTFLFIGLLFSINIFAQTEIATLEMGKLIERELAGGEFHNYQIKLAAGQFLHVVAEQKGIDVVVTLSAPDGKKLLEVDSPNGSRGAESLWFLNDAAGDFKFEIRSLEKDAAAGRYEVKINELRDEKPDDKNFVAAKKLIAEGILFQGEPTREARDKASAKYAEALQRFSQLQDKNRRARGFYQIGRIYKSLGRNKEAIELFKQATVWFEELSAANEAAGSLLEAGDSYEKLELYPDALETFQKALTIASIGGEKRRQAEIYNAIGIRQAGLGDYTQALQNFGQVLKISEKTDYKERYLNALGNIGNIYFYQNNFVRALENFQKQLVLSEAWGISREVPIISLNIGNVYNRQQNYPQALDYHQRALSEFEKIKDGTGIAFATSNIGADYLESGEYDKALEYFLKAQQLKAKLLAKDPYSFSNIGQIYTNQGKYVKALEYQQKSLNLFQELEDQAGIAKTLGDIATILYLKGDYAKTLEFADQSVKLAQQFDYPKSYWTSLYTAAKAHLAFGRKKEAKQALELAIAKIENLRTQIAGGESEQQRFFDDKTAPFHYLIDLSINEGKIAEALAYVERAKSRTLLDVLQNGKIDINKVLTAQEREQEQRLKNEFVLLNNQISKESQQQSDKTRLAELQNQRERKRLEFEDFQTRLYASHPELKVQRGEMKPVGLDEIGALLPDTKSAFLEYVVADDQTFLFVLTKDAAQKVSLKVFPIAVKEKDLAQKVESYRAKLAKGDLDFQQQSRELFDLLVKPARAELQDKTSLVIVPDASLWDLPFQALQNNQNRYLIQQTALSYAPSLTALREMSKKAKKINSGSNLELLAFGNPFVGKETSERIKQVFMDEKLDPLPEAERLVISLGKLYGASRSKIYVGAQAQENIAKNESPKYRIVQFATHGILNNASPMYSHLVLSQSKDAEQEDGLLEAWEMKDLNLNADMVILSACETARGKISSGEGVIGMSWALFIAGAPTTVVSQWKVESSSTTELMLEFHRQLLTGKGISKAEALRRASLKLLKNKQYQHPSYWAGFVIVGDGF